MILKEVIWLGDSKLSVATFPVSIKEDLGFQIYLLQQGRMPRKSRPMKSIGSSVYELKEQDHRGWYRVIYTVQIKGKIYVLHCFKKQSAKTASADIELAKSRLKRVSLYEKK